MKLARLPKRPSLIVSLIVMLSFTLALRGDEIKEDNAQVTQLIADADDEALELANDADDTQGLIRSDENWLEPRIDAGQSESPRGQSRPHHREVE